MFDSQQRSTGIGYTMTVALLTVALVFIPGALILTRPVGNVALALAITCSVVCLSLAWLTWKKLSRLTISSITTQDARSK